MTEVVAGLTNRWQAFWTATKLETIDDHVRAAMQKFDAPATVNSVYLPDAAARERYETKIRETYDEASRTEAQAREREQAAVLRELTIACDEFRATPKEVNLGLDTMREVAALLRYQGRTRADIVSAYATTTDRDNPTLVRLIENDLAAFRLVPDRNTDVEAVTQLTQAIAARRDARVPEQYRAAIATVDTLASSLTTRTLLDHLRAGRGLATARRLEEVA